MKILITGGCGFKGTVLIEKLLEDGHDLPRLEAAVRVPVLELGGVAVKGEEQALARRLVAIEEPFGGERIDMEACEPTVVVHLGGDDGTVGSGEFGDRQPKRLA